MSRYRKAALRDFESYVPGIQPKDAEHWVKLNTNESPHPPAPGVAAALAAQVELLQLYPDPTQAELRETLAQVLDVQPDQVVGGNGADEVLAMCIRAFAPAGSRAAYLEPGYTLVPKLLAINEVDLEEHVFSPDAPLPEAFVNSDAPLKFVVSPNSPLGAVVNLDLIEALCAASKGVVVLDEAYADFAPIDGRAILDRHENLLLVRSLSKSYGLAGLRLGFAIGSPALIEDIWAVKDILNLSRLQLAAGVAALSDRDYWRRGVDEVIANRARLGAALTDRGWKVQPSGANFIFAIPPTNAGDIYRRLLERHVLVRFWPERPMVGDGLRISIGTWEQCQALLDALDS